MFDKLEAEMSAMFEKLEAEMSAFENETPSDKKKTKKTRRKRVEAKPTEPMELPPNQFRVTSNFRNLDEYGMGVGIEIIFEKIDIEEFQDGDFIFIQLLDVWTCGFGYHLRDSIMVRQLFLHPYPKNRIEIIGKLISPQLSNYSRAY